MKYTVYLLIAKNKKSIYITYVGYTKDLKKRLLLHNSSKGAKFTKQKIVKDKFIKCYIKKSRKLIKSVSFNHLKSNISYQILNYKNNLDVLVKVKINKWNSKDNIELEIIDIINNTIKLD